MKNSLIYLAIATALLFSCTDDDPVVDCSLIIPPPNNIFLRILDNQNEPLIGVEFVQDSFRLRRNNSVTYIKPNINGGQPQDLFIFYSQMESGLSYFLDLSETETDTVRMNYTASVNECSTTFVLDQFLYNGEVIIDFGSDGSGPIVTVHKD